MNDENKKELKKKRYKYIINNIMYRTIINITAMKGGAA